jgi:hypothetical protein
VGRNVEIRKLRLGPKIRVSRIFSQVLRSLKGENYEQLSGGVRVPRKLDLTKMGLLDVIDTLPTVLQVVGENYQQFLKLTTDLLETEIEELDLPDLFMVGEQTWDFNGFQEAIENSLGKALGGAGEAPPSEGEKSPASKS